MKAVFLDRDGTLIVGTPVHERVDSLDKVELLPKVIAALKLLKTLDYEVFLFTNQAGISEKLITLDEFWAINDKVLRLISPSDIVIKETLLCPHAETDNCDCRKPKPKLIVEAAERYDINLKESWMIGDRESDVLTGVHAGTQTILVQSGATLDSPDANFIAQNLLEAVEYIKSKDTK